MKKTLLLLLPLFLITSLTACDNPVSSIDTSSSSSSSSSEKQGLQRDNLFDALTNMATNTNYKIDFSIDGNEDALYVTNRYFYRQKMNNGKLLLNGYSNKFPSVFYFMSINNSQVEVGGAYSYTDIYGNIQVYSDIKNIEYFSLMLTSKYQVKKSHLIQKDTKVYSENPNLMSILVGGSLGLQANYINYSGVEFSYDENNDIKFFLYKNGVIDQRSFGTIKNIGSTSNQVIDNYLTSCNNQIPQEKISEDVISNLKASSLSLTHVISLVNETTGEITKIETIKEDYDDSNLSLQDELKSDKSTSKTVLKKTQNEGEIPLASLRLVTAWNQIGNYELLLGGKIYFS